MLLERTGRRRLSEVPLPSGPSDTVVLLIGPEGGWRESEAAEALAKDFVPISLGSRILRAETAAIAAVSIIQSRLGALG
jgi:16S rRNA (uracil1498-N3)-methyltransferase